MPGDAAAIEAIDARYETATRFDAVADSRGFRLVETAIPKRTKRFWVYDLNREDREWNEAHVALLDGRIVGFVATSWQFWNRRLVLWHVYTDQAARGQGIGHALLDVVFERAAQMDALVIHLETSNFNAPGIAWYERQGFRLSGLDTTLYSGARHPDEIGLYFIKTL